MADFCASCWFFPKYMYICIEKVFSRVVFLTKIKASDTSIFRTISGS